MLIEVLEACQANNQMQQFINYLSFLSELFVDKLNKPSEWLKIANKFLGDISPESPIME
jgi:hypothetical protein